VWDCLPVRTVTVSFTMPRTAKPLIGRSTRKTAKRFVNEKHTMSISRKWP
jgi:hypothetical protein